MTTYFTDLRQRILNYGLLHPIRQTAEIFQVSPNTVHLLRKQYYETGDITPRKRNMAPDRLISPEGELWLQAVLAGDPGLSLAELCGRYYDAYKIRVSSSTMHNALRRMGYSYKKKHSMTPSGTPPGRRKKKQATSTSWKT